MAFGSWLVWMRYPYRGLRLLSMGGLDSDTLAGGAALRHGDEDKTGVYV